MSIEEQAFSLARRVATVADTAMRVAYVRHELSQLDPSQVSDLVLVVATKTEARDEGFRRLMLAISLALAAPEAEGLRRSVAVTAHAKGQLEVARLFAEPTEDDDAEGAPDVPDFGVGRPLTLGERKSLARRGDRNLIARVLRDPDPSVIQILLGNPALTEDDVVGLSARRPISPRVLRQVFRTTRWVVRYRVRRALVRNPYTPRDVALQLTAHLSAADARDIARSPEVPDEVRAACRRFADFTALQ